MKTERPIIISKALIPPTLAGDKQVTRRLNGLEVFNENPDEWKFTGMGDPDEKTGKALAYFHKPGWTVTSACPYGDVGHTLWVRENFGSCEVVDNVKPSLWPLDVNTWYAADITGKLTSRTWPAIFMPRIRSRIDLEITGITVERLHDITDQSAKAEGIEPGDKLGHLTWPDYNGLSRKGFFLEGSTYNYNKTEQTAAVASFCTLWHLINGIESWDLNPFVWVISFKLHKPTA